MIAKFAIGLLLLLALTGCASGGTRAGHSATPGALPDSAAPAEPRPAEAAVSPLVAAEPPQAREPADGTAVEPAPAPVAPAMVTPAPPTPPPVTTTPSAKIADKPAARTPAKTTVPARVQQQQKAPAAATSPPPLVLATLEQRLKDTNAIGVFTKLALKNQVDDLVSRVRAMHQGNSSITLSQLRQSYDQLLAKVHGLLKDGDPELASTIMASREAIWNVLTDPVKFAGL